VAICFNVWARRQHTKAQHRKETSTNYMFAQPFHRVPSLTTAGTSTGFGLSLLMVFIVDEMRCGDQNADI